MRCIDHNGGLASVLLQGILKGMLLAPIVSMLLLVRRAAYPHVAMLGLVPLSCHSR